MREEGLALSVESQVVLLGLVERAKKRRQRGCVLFFLSKLKKERLPRVLLS